MCPGKARAAFVSLDILLPATLALTRLVTAAGPGRAKQGDGRDRLPKLQLASPMTIHIREKGRNISVFYNNSRPVTEISEWPQDHSMFFFSKPVWMLLSHDPEMRPSHTKQLQKGER
jgi:hypothetical protein